MRTTLQGRHQQREHHRLHQRGGQTPRMKQTRVPTPNATADFRAVEGRRGSWNTRMRITKSWTSPMWKETSFQDDTKWTVNNVSDLCIPEHPAIKTAMDDMAFYDENTVGEVGSALGKGGRKGRAREVQEDGCPHTYAGRRL